MKLLMWNNLILTIHIISPHLQAAAAAGSNSTPNLSNPAQIALCARAVKTRLSGRCRNLQLWQLLLSKPLTEKVTTMPGFVRLRLMAMEKKGHPQELYRCLLQ